MPEPSRLVLLEQLHTVPSGTKVRFLGCVHAYEAKQAQLVLKTQYPATDPDLPHAIVDVQTILQDVGCELLATGAWVNVIGYTSVIPHSRAVKPNTRPSDAVAVSAMIIWSAGAIRSQRYEDVVREYQKPLNREG